MKTLRKDFFQNIVDHAKEATARFPAVTFSAGVITVLSIFRNHDPSFIKEKLLLKIVLTALLAMPLFFAIKVWKENFTKNKTLPYVINFLSAFFLVFYFWQLEESFTYEEHIFLEFFLWSSAFHLLASFMPFVKKGSIHGFWKYNEVLFLRFVIGAFYAVVMYLGMAMAFLAMDYLLGIKIDKLYFDTWLIIAVLFQTYFFLSGIPKNLKSLEDSHTYPKALKVFCQYILLPLLGLYLLILYIYTIKILATWTLPKGYVSWLVIAMIVFGLFTYLLLYPLQKKEAHLKKIFSLFFKALIPLNILLLYAIGIRISDYGFTEMRFLVLILGVWVLILTLYFNFSKKKNIKIIPFSLSLLIFTMSFGPWSIFNISENSQINRLKNILTADQKLKDGKIVKNLDWVEDKKDVESILKYLKKWHGYKSIQPWFEESLDKLYTAKILKILHYKDYDDDSHIRNYYNFRSNYYDSLPLKNAVAIFFFDGMAKDIYALEKDYQVDVKDDILSVKNNDQKLDFNFVEIFQNLEKFYSNNYNSKIDSKLMTFEKSNKRFKATLYIENFSYYKRNLTKLGDLYGVMIIEEF